MSSYERFDAVESVKVSPKDQKELISKLQKNQISSSERNLLIGSLYNWIIKQARKFENQFPDRSLEDLVSDGIFHLWLRLPTYDPERGYPSTFATVVLQTAYLKELSKLKNRTAKQDFFDEESSEMVQMSIPNLSLNHFLDNDGGEYEPDALGCNDGKKKDIEEKIEYESMVEEMFKNVCSSVKDFQILTNILNIKKLPNFGGGRRRKSIKKISEIHGVNFNYVEKIAEKVQPWLKRHDFISHIVKNEYIGPSLKNIFLKDEVAEYFIDEECFSEDSESDLDDVWGLMGKVEEE